MPMNRVVFESDFKVKLAGKQVDTGTKPVLSYGQLL